MVDFQVYERKVMFGILQVNVLIVSVAKLSLVGVAPVSHEAVYAIQQPVVVVVVFFFQYNQSWTSLPSIVLS